jgi:TPR repeat protein
MLMELPMVSGAHSERFKMIINDINDNDKDSDKNQNLMIAVNSYLGLDCEVDLEKSFDYVNKAVIEGNNKAKYLLCLMYL